MDEELEIKVPATSANLGLGFDSMGIALEKFLTIKAKPSEEWLVTFEQDELAGLPSDDTNLVFKAAKAIAKRYNKKLPVMQISMASDIPLSHGLGSSSSAIVAGIELADLCCDLNLSDTEKITLASEIEGHPDNVGPCITGGGFVGYYDLSGEVYYATFDLEGVSLITSIPEYEINTNQARRALPDSYSRSVAVQQNAMNNVMIMALIQKDYATMGTLMMRDHFHEPYRQSLIKEFDLIKEKALDQGAYATVISGAGPTVLTLCPEEQVEAVLATLREIPNCEHELTHVYYK